MGTIATNLLPNATGLDLGSPNQRFDIFAKDVTADALSSNTVNPATTGEINLATTDAIAWRDSTNSTDILLNKSQGAGLIPADTLQWPNAIMGANFISASTQTAQVGVVRLSSFDSINFRNNANSGDLNGLSHNSDDTIQVGDAAGIKTAALASTSIISTGGVFASPAGTDILIEPQGTSGNAVNLTASDGTTGGAVNVLAGSGSAGNGGVVTITGGNSATSATGGDISLVPGTGISGQGSVFLNGVTKIPNKIALYNGVTTAGQGVPIVVAFITLTAQTLAIGSTSLFTAATAGLYRLNYSLTVDVVGNAVNLTGTWGWMDAAAHTLVTGNIACNTLGANSTSALGLGSIVFAHSAGFNINYATALSGAIGTGQYTLRLVLEQLG